MACRYVFLLLIVSILFSSCASPPKGPELTDGGVRFSLYAPGATSVSITGTFNRWDPRGNQLKGPDSRGIWSVLLPLPPGRHEYLFIINEKKWLTDPAAPTVDDGMGEINSILIVEY